MCMGAKTPKAPDPLPERQAARAPQLEAQGQRDMQRNTRRLGFARMITTSIAARNAAVATTGKALLGQ